MLHSGKAADIEEFRSLVTREKGDNYKDRHGVTVICKRSRGRISNTKISNILIKLIIIFIVTLLMNMCLV
jgi:hypothetical protein